MSNVSSGSVVEPSCERPVIGEYDLCVLGGSCTGVFAAVRAARLGLKVALVERMGAFGGVATISMVNYWHSPYDEAFRFEIFSGLTVELMQRLSVRNAVREKANSPDVAWCFNPWEMQIELDKLVLEHGIDPWLHTAFAAPYLENGNLAGVFVENKSGRGVIRARFFIDATGDGDLCHRLGLPTYTSSHYQPSTTCAIINGWESLGQAEWGKLLMKHGDAYGLPAGFAWKATMPDAPLTMLAGTRVHENCTDARGFTQAEMEGRRQVRAIVDILNQNAPGASLSIQGLPARIGIRETRHVRCLHPLTGEDILNGVPFEDAVAQGSYRVDIHHRDKPGITFKYLDGRQTYSRPGFPQEHGRWRPEGSDHATFYRIPFRSLIPDGPFDNLLVAGRMIDADEAAHAAIRVMVNMNQTGEAAGVAAALALKQGRSVRQLNVSDIRSNLVDGGSILYPVSKVR